MKIISSILLFTLIYLTGFCQIYENNKSIPIKETIHPFKLGNKKVHVILTTYGNNKDVVMINLHDNERTSVEAAKIVLLETGGTLIRIENDNKRLIDFIFKKSKFQFDPNRIFTKAGTTATLNKYSVSTPASVSLVSKFGEFIYKLIPASTLLIALHNNTDSTYSSLSYLPGAEYGIEASAVHINKQMDIDDFFFTTSDSLFTKLKLENNNVILQNNSAATDDGSLSVLYGIWNKKYVNVEAEKGHVNEQEKMIRLLLHAILLLK